MKIPRIIIGSAAGWIRLYQVERRENARLRRELTEWQNRILQLKGVQPLFTPPPPRSEPAKRAPVGQSMKNAYLAGENTDRNSPTAEQVLGIQ